MNEILTLVTFLALLFYTGIEMKFQLQMLHKIPTETTDTTVG